MPKAYVAIQCRPDPNKPAVGTFLYCGQWESSRVAVSPIFSSMADLAPWLESNGWTPLPYDPAHPCGAYEKPELGTEESNAFATLETLARWKEQPNLMPAYAESDAAGAYVTTFTGVALGTIESYTVSRSGFRDATGRRSRIAAIRVRGTNGAAYAGRYGIDSGSLVRLRKVKG